MSRRRGRRKFSIRDRAIANMYWVLGITTLVFKLTTGGTVDNHAWNDWITWFISLFFVAAIYGLGPNLLTHWLIDKGESRGFVAWTSGFASAVSVYVVNSFAVITEQQGIIYTPTWSRVIYLASIVLLVALGVWHALRPRKSQDKGKPALAAEAQPEE